MLWERGKCFTLLGFIVGMVFLGLTIQENFWLFPVPSTSNSQDFFSKTLTSIHQAKAGDLMKIKGISQKKALKILDFLQENPSATVESLGQINGIGAKTVEKIKKELRFLAK